MAVDINIKLDYTNTKKITETLFHEGDFILINGKYDQGNSFLILRDQETGVEAGRISWDEDWREFFFEENADPRCRRTAELYKIMDALHKDLYMDDRFIVQVVNPEDYEWSQYEGVFGVIEVVGGKPRMIDLRYKSVKFIEYYDNETGRMEFDHTEREDREISEEEFFAIADRIKDGYGWRMKTKNIEALEAYRGGEFDIKNFFKPVNVFEGDHWHTVYSVCQDGWGVDLEDLGLCGRHLPTDREILERIKENGHKINPKEPVWLYSRGIYGRRRKVVAAD